MWKPPKPGTALALPALLAVAAPGAVPSGPALAQAQMPRPPCELRSKLIERLAQAYEEISVATGLANDGKLVEVLTNAGGDTWSIIVTSPQGISCLVATGEDWRKLEPAAAEPKI